MEVESQIIQLLFHVKQLHATKLNCTCLTRLRCRSEGMLHIYVEYINEALKSQTVIYYHSHCHMCDASRPCVVRVFMPKARGDIIVATLRITPLTLILFVI